MNDLLATPLLGIVVGSFVYLEFEVFQIRIAREFFFAPCEIFRSTGSHDFAGLRIYEFVSPSFAIIMDKRAKLGNMIYMFTLNGDIVYPVNSGDGLVRYQRQGSKRPMCSLPKVQLFRPGNW